MICFWNTVTNAKNLSYSFFVINLNKTWYKSQTVLDLDIYHLISTTNWMINQQSNCNKCTFSWDLRFIMRLTLMLLCGKGELFSKFKTKLGYLPHFLKARHCLKKSKQKLSAYLGCEYFKTERAGNSSCSYLSKKVVDILISYWTLKIIHLYYIGRHSYLPTHCITYQKSIKKA